MIRSAVLFALLVVLAMPAYADDVNTAVSVVPFPSAPTKELPIKINSQKWGVPVFWNQDLLVLGIVPIKRGGWFEVYLATPTVIASRVNDGVKSNHLNKIEAQNLWQKHLAEYYGNPGSGGFGTRISFIGELVLDGDSYSIEDADAAWNIYLLTVDGTQYKPSRVIWGDVSGRTPVVIDSGPAKLWTRSFYATFDNINPASKHRIASAQTKSLTFALAGLGNARFEFDAKQK